MNSDVDIDLHGREIRRCKVFRKAYRKENWREALSEMGRRGAAKKAKLRQQVLTPGEGFTGDEYWQK